MFLRERHDLEQKIGTLQDMLERSGDEEQVKLFFFSVPDMKWPRFACFFARIKTKQGNKNVARKREERTEKAKGAYTIPTQ